MKKSIQLLGIFTLMFFVASTVLSQPATTGCHFAHQHVVSEPLTVEQERSLRAVIERSDTFDVLHYDINLDVTKFDQRQLQGECTVTFTTKMDDISSFSLDLLDMAIDRIHSNGQDLNYTRDGFVIQMEWPEIISLGDTNSVTVIYRGKPTVSMSSFGGFYFEGGYAYNLGIDLIGNPHNFGRSWFPCFDNFVERATYDISLMTSGGRSGYAVGDFMGEVAMGGDTIVRSYAMQKQLPTYLVGVAVSDYVEENSIHSGAYGDIPVQIVAKPGDMTDARNSLAFLPDAIDCLEYWYGPYVWNRVGYVMTLRGAMEHASSIAYPDNSIAGGALSTRLMTHELCHHWWGNIITVNYAPDMWIKEGNAEYGAHLIEEFIGGAEPFRETVRNNHYFVITTAHEEDGAYLALSPLSQENTYGRHTYYRGASMLHNMRAYLGDSLFRAGQQELLNKNAYSYLNAQSYRDKLSVATGMDMTSYFDDWIFSPGYADWYFHHATYSELIGELNVVIGQNQYNSGHFHDETPVPITLYFADGSSMDTRINVGGELDSAIIRLVPSKPIGIAVNKGHIMNLGMFEDAVHVTEIGDYKDPRANYKLDVDVLTDSFEFVVENHLTAPGGSYNSDNYRLSQRHFWHITGTHEDKFEGKLFLYYDDNDDLVADDDLTSMSEDSLALMYRPDASKPWQEYFDYNKLVLLPNDGRGTIIMETVRNGDYTFANRLDGVVSNQNILSEVEINLFPNPANEFVQLNLGDHSFQALQLFAMDGKLIYATDEVKSNMTIPVKHIEPGEYFIYLSNDEEYATQKFIKY